MRRKTQRHAGRAGARGALLALIGALVLALGIALPAGATRPQSGTFTIARTLSTFQVLNSKQVGGNTFEQYTVDGMLTGLLYGSFSATGTQVFHANHIWSSKSEGTCESCTVSGSEGALSYSLTGTGTWVLSGSERTPTTFRGLIHGSGSGGLAGLHFQGQCHITQVVGVLACAVTYHFHP